MRFQRLFVLLAALWLVGPWPASAEPFEVMIPQGVYSADTVFGPFQAPTGGGFLFLDVDSLTGTTPTYRLCIAAVEMNTGGTFPDTRVDCNNAVATTGSPIQRLFSLLDQAFMLQFAEPVTTVASSMIIMPLKKSAT